MKIWPVKGPPGLSKMDSIGLQAERIGDTKVRRYSLNDTSLPCHRKLLENGLPVAEIISEVAEEGLITKTTKWVEGKTFYELHNEKLLTMFDWCAFGEFFAQMNMIGVTSWDIVTRNILRKPDGTVILCDLAKLYCSDFPEEPVIRYILNNIFYSQDWKLAFIEGYNRHRPITLKGLLDKEIGVNYDRYQDLYLNDELLCSGVRSNKRLSMLKDNFTGKKVLDIGCSSGMFARYAAKSGAQAVMSSDSVVRSQTRNMVDLAAYLSYLEGLAIQFVALDCEHDYFIKKTKDVKWDVIFFLAMVGHLKGDRVKYVKWLKSLTKVLYYETNLGGGMVQAEIFLKEVGFSKVECLGESGDPDRDKDNHYVLYRCET